MVIAGDKVPYKEHSRKYNAPVVCEIAAVISGM